MLTKKAPQIISPKIDLQNLRLLSDKQKCINKSYNSKSQVYYKLYTNVQTDNETNSAEANAMDEDNVGLFVTHSAIKKQVIVYYDPPKKLESSCRQNASFFLQNMAHNFISLCFCRSHYHHYPSRRLGTF